MFRANKWFSGLISFALILSVLAGCGAKQEPASAPAPEKPAGSGNQQAAAPAPKPNKNPVSLLVWSKLTDPEVAEVNRIAQEWAAKTGNKVEVLNDQGDFQAFATAAQSGQGPDVMYGIPHDNLGTFWKAGLLAEVPKDLLNKDLYVPMSLNAVSYDGKMYGVPIAMEAVALFYNKKLVANPPKTWAEMESVAQKAGFQYDLKSFYFSFGFIQGYGGYVFKNNGGALDPKDIGLANPGAVQALQLLGDMVNKHKWMPVDVGGDMAKGLFTQGKVGMYISGPWDVQGFRDAQVDFGVAPVPTLPNGKPFAPFVGVSAGFVSIESRKQKEAFDLLKYLNENTGIPLFKAGNRIPVIKSLLDHADVKANTIMSGFATSASNGTPMPNIPQMNVVWGPAGTAISLVVEGKATAEKAAKDSVTAINEAVAGMR